MWFLVRGTKESKNIYERKRDSSLEWHGNLEEFQTTIYLKGYMGRLHSTHDIRAFHSRITVRYGESTSACSRFCYHAYQRLCSICFACEADGKIFFINIFNWQHFYFSGYDSWTGAKPDGIFCWNACVELITLWYVSFQLFF